MAVNKTDARKLQRLQAWEPPPNAATIIAAAPDMLAALKLAKQTIAGTLKDRGYEPGSCTDEWTPTVRKEVATHAALRRAIAKAEGKP
jgi:hypothetical protein